MGGVAGDGPTMSLMRKQAQRDPRFLQVQEYTSRPELEHKPLDMAAHVSASLVHRLAMLGISDHFQSEISRRPLKR